MSAATTDAQIAENATWEQIKWAALQAQDPDLRRYLDAAHGLATPVSEIQRRRPTVDGHGRLYIHYGTAHTSLLVVPREMRHALVMSSHAAMAHRHAAAVKDELLRTHWWPGMTKDIEDSIRGCMLCQAYTQPARETAPGSSFPPAARFAAVHADFVEMPRSDGYIGFFLIVDRTTGASRYAPVHTKSTASMISALQTAWIAHFGPPRTITVDGALETTSNAWRAFCRRSGITPVTTTPYNKQANGLVERAVQTIKRGVLAATHNAGAESWVETLPQVLYAYACATQPARGGVSPYELTFGTRPPITGAAHEASGIAPAQQEFTASDGASIAAAAKAGAEAAQARAAAAQAATAAARVPEEQFRTGDVVWLENTDSNVGATAFAKRQKRHGPYVVHTADLSKPRVTLRVLATGRIVRKRQTGQVGPLWVATRRLTRVVGDPARAGGGWRGVHDRGALPAGERADQLAQDVAAARLPKRARAIRIAPDDAEGVSVGDGSVAAVHGWFRAPTGERVIVVLHNGLAADVAAIKYPQLMAVARQLSARAQVAAVAAAPSSLSIVDGDEQ